MPNIGIQAEVVLKVSCEQGFSIAIMAESKKKTYRHSAILGPTIKKKVHVCIIFVLMLHINFQDSTHIGFRDIEGT